VRIEKSILTQLQDFQRWASTGASSGAASLLDYVGFVGTLDGLFAHAELFYPERVIHNGRQFLASGFTPQLYDDWISRGLRPKEVQRVLNHVHVSTLLQNQAVTDEAAVEVAKVIAHIWNRTLGPEGVIVESAGATFADAAVTFSQTGE
jgi:hypothetical protein